MCVCVCVCVCIHKINENLIYILEWANGGLIQLQVMAFLSSQIMTEIFNQVITEHSVFKQPWKMQSLVSKSKQ